MPHVINGENAYTEEEIGNVRTNAQFIEQARISDLALEVLRDKVTNDVITEDVGLDIYNSLASAVGGGFSSVETLLQLWTVTVTYQYETVLEVSDVRAGTEEEAIDEVRSNLNIDRARLSFNIEYDGESSASDSHDIEFDADDIYTDLEFSAEEQG